MYPQYKLAGELLAGNQYRTVVASRDEFGVPHLSPGFIWHWDEDAVWYAKLPGSRTANNTQMHPEVSVSIVDWAKVQGLQLKGLVTRETRAPQGAQGAAVWERLRGAGATEVYRIEVMEVFDVLPRQGGDLSVPMWQRRRGWVGTRSTPEFTKPALKPLAIPDGLASRIAPLTSMMRTQFMPSFVGTVGDDGVPNISPRFILEIGPDYWFYGDGFRNKTFVNASRPSPLCIAIVDWQREHGFLAHGWSEMRYTGDWLEKIKTHWDAMSFKNVAIQAVLFRPEDIEEISLGQPVSLFRGRPATAWAQSGRAPLNS